MSKDYVNELAAAIQKELPADPNLRLVAWQDITTLLKKVKAIESNLRKELQDHFFKKPKEGTNTVDLGNGWKTQLKAPMSRKCDEASFDAVFSELPRGFKQKLIKFEPKLVTSEYRKLTPEQKVIFDQALIIKPGAGTLSLVPPKEA